MSENNQRENNIDHMQTAYSVIVIRNQIEDKLHKNGCGCFRKLETLQLHISTSPNAVQEISTTGQLAPELEGLLKSFVRHNS